MSLFKVFDIAGSGIHAQSIRLNTIASNLANAESAGSSEAEAYRAKQPIFETLVDSFASEISASEGVEVTKIVESSEALKKEYMPNHPKANEEGFVFYPNVNVMEEMANMVSASRTYQMNVEIANLSKTMMLRTLSMGQ